MFFKQTKKIFYVATKNCTLNFCFKTPFSNEFYKLKSGGKSFYSKNDKIGLVPYKIIYIFLKTMITNIVNYFFFF